LLRFFTTERQVWRYGAKQPRADTRHSVQGRQIAEGSVRLTVGHDRFGQTETNAWKPRELHRRCHVPIDPLARPQWPRLVHGTVPLR
jgi:hypothetical protein